MLHLALPLHLPSPDTHTPFSPRSFIATSTSSELVFGFVAPLRQFALSSRRKPWVNPQIRALMRSRDRAYRFARSSGAAADVARFRLLRAQPSNPLDSAKNSYVASRLAATPTSDAKWRELRRLHVTRPGLPSPLVNFTADNLNVFSASTVSRHPPITEQDFEAIANQPSSQLSNDLFCLHPFSSHEVADTLQKSSSKASGHDGLSLSQLSN